MPTFSDNAGNSVFFCSKVESQGVEVMVVAQYVSDCQAGEKNCALSQTAISWPDIGENKMFITLVKRNMSNHNVHSSIPGNRPFLHVLPNLSPLVSHLSTITN